MKAAVALEAMKPTVRSKSNVVCHSVDGHNRKWCSNCKNPKESKTVNWVAAKRAL